MEGAASSKGNWVGWERREIIVKVGKGAARGYSLG